MTPNSGRDTQVRNSTALSSAEKIHGVLNTCTLLMVLKETQIAGFGATIVPITLVINLTVTSA